ncbi:MAG: hypothetical protein Q7T05_02920 [Dehalococcoidia bacterium]|nr:hypothetical protein [Dehalococcoidia bacterium]
MARPFVIVTLFLIALSLIFVGACGSPPSAGVGSGSSSSQAIKWDFKYTGTLASDQDSVTAVMSFLQSEAKSNSGRVYLAEYLMVATSRVTEASDGNWYITFGMDRKPDSEQGEKAYWDAAAWLVFKDGTVMPSDRHSGNATRIMTDLHSFTN